MVSGAMYTGAHVHFLLKRFWSLLWSEISFWRASSWQRKEWGDGQALLTDAAPRAGSQTDRPIGWLLGTPAVSWGGCGLTTFLQVSGSSLQATWLRRRASTWAAAWVTVRLTHLLPQWGQSFLVKSRPFFPFINTHAIVTGSIWQVDVCRSHLKHPKR